MRVFHPLHILSIFLFCAFIPADSDAQDILTNIKNGPPISIFYDENNGRQFWVEKAKLNRDGKDLLAILEQSWKNGLNPQHYNIKDIKDILDTTQFNNFSNEEKSYKIELLLTDGYVKYMQDLSGMRISAKDIQLSPKHWRQKISTEKALSFLPKHKDNIFEFLLRREPQTQTYQRLKSELIKLAKKEGYQFTKKIKQIIVNMERLRWINDYKPEKFIVVNIPSATLWAIENGEIKIQEPVIIGSKYRQTRSFIADIHGVRFNPTWTIPPTIKREDILPILKVNPLYLSDKGIELYDGVGGDAKTLDPKIIDWPSITDLELNNLRMVQTSGENNPLGRIRILMPNNHSIYLHDTNDKTLFSKSDRAQSSGCVRVSSPRAIANFILSKKGNWNKQLINTTIKNGEMIDIHIDKKLPVYFLYHTVRLGDNGRIIYEKDIYNRDKLLRQHLEKLDESRLISNNI